MHSQQQLQYENLQIPHPLKNQIVLMAKQIIPIKKLSSIVSLTCSRWIFLLNQKNPGCNCTFETNQQNHIFQSLLSNLFKPNRLRQVHIKLPSSNCQFFFQVEAYNQLTQFVYIKIIQAMNFYYFFQATTTPVPQFQPVFYIPPQLQQPVPNFLVMSPNNPSQKEQKQNFILQANATTRESLQQDSEEKGKTQKKKKPVKKEKDENFGWRNQNKDRNIMSNILKAFIIYLLEHEETKKFIEKIYKKLDLQSGVSAFFNFVQKNFPLTKSYISPKQLKTFLNDPSQSESLTMVFKLALIRFLRMDYSLILLKSTKIKKRSKMEQMKKSRELILALFSK